MSADIDVTPGSAKSKSCEHEPTKMHENSTSKMWKLPRFFAIPMRQQQQTRLIANAFVRLISKTYKTNNDERRRWERSAAAESGWRDFLLDYNTRTKLSTAEEWQTTHRDPCAQLACKRKDEASEAAVHVQADVVREGELRAIRQSNASHGIGPGGGGLNLSRK